MLGKRINELRINRGRNQVDLAKKLGVTKQTVSNWENGNIQPSIEMLIRISKCFGVTTDFLLGLEETIRINVDGLPMNVISHISLLLDDFKNK